MMMEMEEEDVLGMENEDELVQPNHSQVEPPQPGQAKPPLSFEDARGLFAIGTATNVIPLATPVDGVRKKGRPRKNPLPPPPTPWESILESYQFEARSNGLSMEDIDAIWDAIEKPKTGSKLRSSFKAEFVLVMIPSTTLPPKLIERMLNWVVCRIAKSHVLPRLEKNVMMYFVGLLEYNLVDATVFAEPFYYKLLSNMRHQEGLIPLLCLLLKLVVNPSLLNKSTVNDLIAFHTSGMIIPAMKAVEDLLRVYKSIRPQLVPNSVLKTKIISAKHPDLLDEEFRKTLFAAQFRLTGRQTYFGENQTEKNLDPTVYKADMFFPEFQPSTETLDGSQIDFEDLRITDRMHFFLRLEETTPMLLQDCRILHRFYSWVDLILKHKFNHYDAKQHHRYKFIIDRCLLITQLSNKSIPPIEDWILEFFLEWDGELFRHEIMMFLPYISVINLEENQNILDKLEDEFLGGTLSGRMEIWNVLFQWFIRWNQELKDEGDPELAEDGLPVISKFILQLWNFMTKLMGLYAADGPVGENMMVFYFLDKYEILLDKYIESNDDWLIPPFAPQALWYMVLASNSLIMLNLFCGLALKMHAMGFTREDGMGFSEGVDLFLEVCNFFTNSFPLRSLFEAECVVLFRTTEKPQRAPVRASEPGDPTPTKRQNERQGNKDAKDWLRTLASYNCYTCDCLQEYEIFKKGNHKHSKFDMEKLAQDAPFVAKLITIFENDSNSNNVVQSQA